MGATWLRRRLGGDLWQARDVWTLSKLYKLTIAKKDNVIKVAFGKAKAVAEAPLALAA